MEERETDITLEEFGNLLREERVRSGYTVDEVASRLKITARVVRAIEDGDMASMPHAVYARGFIRAYARILGISEEEVTPVCALLRDPDEEQNSEPIKVTPRASDGSAYGLWGMIILFFVIIGCAGWYFREDLPLDFFTTMMQSSDQQATPAEPRLPPEAQSGEQHSNVTPVAPISEQAPRTTSPTEAPVPVAVPEKPVSQNTDEASPVRVSGFTPPVTSSATAENNNLTLQNGSEAPTSLTTNTSGRKHQVILTALAECWVHSTADGTDTRQLSIQKGETFSLSFDRKLVIKLGNAGGVRIKFDGSELPPAGTSGQVKTITFPQQDVQN